MEIESPKINLNKTFKVKSPPLRSLTGSAIAEEEKLNVVSTHQSQAEGP